MQAPSLPTTNVGPLSPQPLDPQPLALVEGAADTGQGASPQQSEELSEVLIPVRGLLDTDANIIAIIKDVRKQLDGNVKDDKHGLGRASRYSRNSSSSRTSGPPQDEALVSFPRGAVAQNGQPSRRLGTLHNSRFAKQGWCMFCRMVCGEVLHPESRFRSIWNVVLSLLILYCGFSVPFEIAFEQDMVQSMCIGDEMAAAVPRAECSSYLWWFWLNFLIDLWFIVDVVINFRTGYMLEGHFVNDDWATLTHYLKGSFLIDFLGSFPLNLVFIALDPAHPYGREPAAYASDPAGGDSQQEYGRINKLLRLLRMTKLVKLARMFKLAK